MNKKLLWVIAAVILIGGGYFLLTNEQSVSAADYKNIAYTIDGQTVTLHDGLSETAAATGSASKIVTKYFGNEATGDLNGDGIPDIAFLLTQETGGTGTFYYVVAAVQNADGSYSGSDAVLLGDRIAPQTTEIRDGTIIVNYADRTPGEPMTAQPSVGKSLSLKLDPETMQLSQVAQPIATAAYTCDGDKTIQAAYYQGAPAPAPAPGEPPTPTGSVALVLSDGRSMTLPQTISADGIRYANTGESFIFWSKGTTAFVMEGNAQTYANCVEAAASGQ